MDHQRLGIADVGQMREDAQGLDELASRRPAALEGKAEHGTGAARQQLLRQRVVGMIFKFGVADACNGLVAGQVRDGLARIGNVSFHAQRQGLDPLQQLEGGHRAHAGAEVAQALATCAQEKGGDGGFLAEIHAVKAFIGLGEGRELAARGLPVKGSAIDQQAADGDTVAAEEFGRGMENQVGAMIEGPHQPGCGEGAVHHQRQAMLMGQRGHRRDVEHVEAGIAQRLAEQQSRFGADRGAPGVNIARIDEGSGDAEARQGVVEQVVRAAIQ